MRALLDFAVQVTRQLNTVTRESVEALRQLGWRDEQIHDAVQVIALFNYYTRLAEALGIEPEDFMRAGEQNTKK
jgi:alkylhydroperoxidase family enzyme